MPPAPPKPASIVFVTGPSGAGRSTAIHALEDLGFETIDNLPLGLLSRLLKGSPPDRPLALGIDSRTRDFSTDELIRAFEELSADPAYEVDLVYVDCEASTLQRRYSETRRRHPLAPDAEPAEGIALDRDLVGPLRGIATVLIDTTLMTPHDTRAEIGRFFAHDKAPGLSIQLSSFSYRRGLPPGADLVFDCRFLRNPHWDDKLRPLTGHDADVRAYIAEDARFAPFVEQMTAMFRMLLPAFREEGKSHLTIAFGCTGGKHRSVAMTEIMASCLADDGWRVSKRHRDVDRARNPGNGAAASRTNADGEAKQA